MYLYKEDFKELLDEFLSNIESDFKDAVHTVGELAKEDDWSFVIKAHALIETVITSMLVGHLNDKKTEGVIKRLPLSDKQTGKIALCKDMALLEKDERRFISFFSELRNKIVHNFENVGFDFPIYFEQMNKQQKKSFYKDVCWYQEKDAPILDWHFEKADIAKIALWLAVVSLLHRCFLKMNLNDIQQKVNEKSEQATTETVERQQELNDEMMELVNSAMALAPNDVSETEQE